MKKELAGEFLGTFILVFIGLSSIVAAEMLGWLNALWQVALVWGVGVTTAIYLTRAYSHSHLNPAVSLAFLFMREINAKQFFNYVLFQFAGAFFAGACLYLVFGGTIIAFEETNGVHVFRGSRSLAGGEPAMSRAMSRQSVEIEITAHGRSWRRLRHLRTQGFYSGDPYPSRRYSHGFYSGR